MHKLLRFLQQASYSKTRLIEMMLIILVISLMAAALSSLLSRRSQSDVALFFDEVLHHEQADVYEELSKLLRQPDFSFDGLLNLIPLLAEFDDADEQGKILASVEQANFSDIQKALFTAALRSWTHDAPDRELVNRASETPPVRYANRLLGDFHRQAGNLNEAVRCYEIESGFPEARASRRRLLNLLVGQERLEKLTELRENPLFDDAFDPFILRDLAIKERDLPGLIGQSLKCQYHSLRGGLVGMALFTGLLWFALCMKLGQISPILSSKTVLCLVAFVLGVLSAHITLVASILQEEWLGFTMQTELVSGLIYAIAGIGLREEGIKLLCVLPLVPVLVKRGDYLDWLMIPAFVGLGFAAEENLGYFHQSNSLSAPSRFLTANFFHITATALTGQALCRLWNRPRSQGDDFLALFGMVVVLHGLYDALLMLPGLADYSLFAFTAFIFLCYQFFGELRPLRVGGADRYSLTSLFLLAISLLFGMTLVYLGTFLGVRSAVILVFPVVVEVAVLVYMFVREFREPIA